MKKSTFTLGINELGVSQLYLCREKINRIKDWFSISEYENYQPLPVIDCGNAKYALTDGHSRAYVYYINGIKKVIVEIDNDDIVTCEIGQRLMKTSLSWCERFGLKEIPDLENRIVSAALYDRLWIQRCDRMYNMLMSKSIKEITLNEKLFLYGVSEDLAISYYENESGDLYKLIDGILYNEELKYGEASSKVYSK